MISDIPINNSSVFTCASRMKSLTMHIVLWQSKRKQEEVHSEAIFSTLGNQTRNFLGGFIFLPMFLWSKWPGISCITSWNDTLSPMSWALNFKSIVSNVKKGSNSMSAHKSNNYLRTTSKSQWQIHHSQITWPPRVSPASDLAVRKAWLVPLFGWLRNGCKSTTWKVPET